jgi:5-methylcytosine-specific restriction enzyme subunit McrC
VAQAPDNQRILRELGFAYADVAEVPFSALRWDEITLDRMWSRRRGARLHGGRNLATTTSFA